MFFENWGNLARVVVMSVCAYAALILILRISGKRTLSKMNAFDFVVTVALGSTLATIVVSRDLALAEGVVALAMLVLLQFAATWLSVRSARMRGLLRGEPTLLLFRGEFLREAMRAQRVTESEVRQAARSQGVSDLAEHAVVLETDGRFSALSVGGSNGEPAILDVKRPRA